MSTTRRRVIILGNAGSGKTTFARDLARKAGGVPVLPLDDVAFGGSAERRPLAASLSDIEKFVTTHGRWVIEGCYADLFEPLLPLATELHFLNPGLKACIAHCRARPWEPGKFETPEDQAAVLPTLIQWVSQYETRVDEYGLARHRAVFDSFTGTKREYLSAEEYGFA